MSASSSTTSRAGRAAAADSGADGMGCVANAADERALEAGFAVASAERLRRAAKSQPRALEQHDRGAKLIDVGKEMRGEEQRASLGAQALQHVFYRLPRGRVKASH